MGYLPELSDCYEGDLLIINMKMMEHKDMVDHLSPREVKDIASKTLS